MTETNRSVVVIIRPPADPRRLVPLQQAIALLRTEGYTVRARLTWEQGDARRWARAAAMRGTSVVVAAGGDGTINQVVNGLAAAGSDTALGVVPIGTANDFARGLDLPLDPVAALYAAVKGKPKPLDVARVNRRCFVNVSTGGVAAEATRRAGRRFKRVAGGLSYVFGGARLFWDYRTCDATFRADGTVIHEGPFAFFAVANASMTGGGTPVAPHARTQDGLLDITIVGDMSRTELLRLLPYVRAGTHLTEPGVVSARARRFTVHTPEPMAVNADGEMVAGDSFRYDLMPRKMLVMLP